MSREIVQQWLDAVVHTARELDYDAHMDLVSRRVQVHGVPNLEVVGFEDWARQCKHEFSNGVLKAVGYNGLRMIDATDTRIMFQTLERVEATDGTVVRHGLEVLLEKESDGKWRVVKERIMPDDETVYCGLLEKGDGGAS
jgi:ketosteroid isomerase-like protein